MFTLTCGNFLLEHIHIIGCQDYWGHFRFQQSILCKRFLGDEGLCESCVCFQVPSFSSFDLLSMVHGSQLSSCHVSISILCIQVQSRLARRKKKYLHSCAKYFQIIHLHILSYWLGLLIPYFACDFTPVLLDRRPFLKQGLSLFLLLYV